MSRMSENPVLKFYLMPVQNEIIVVFFIPSGSVMQNY